MSTLTLRLFRLAARLPMSFPAPVEEQCPERQDHGASALGGCGQLKSDRHPGAVASDRHGNCAEPEIVDPTVLRTIRRLTQRLSASATSDISGGVRHSVGDGNYVAGVKTRRCGRSEEPPLTARIRQRHITTTLSAVRAHRGTEGSNPFPSSGESANFRYLSGTTW